MNNCNYKVVLQVSELHTQKYFSELFGTTQTPQISESTNFSRESDTISSRATSTSYQDAPIIKPQQCPTPLLPLR